MSEQKRQSPASDAFDEAIKLGIEERSPYPERALFVDIDAPNAGEQIKRAADEGVSVVLVDVNGTALVMKPQALARPSLIRAAG
jgi:hypothetical protein